MRLNLSNFANFLITSSLVSTLYVYYPILKLELSFRFQPKLTQIPKSTQFGIVIDSLGINEAITANVDPFNKFEYLPVLKQHVAHAKNTKLPGENGHIYLFSHSSDNPLSITRYNTSFYLLDRLKPGDIIKLYYQHQLFEYIVRELIVVKPQDVNNLIHQNRNQLTLQTCTPVGTAINRLLVFADPI